MCFALFFRMPTLMDFIDFHSMFSFLSFLISVGMYSKMVDVVKTCQSTPAFMGNITVAMIQLYTQSMVVVFTNVMISSLGIPLVPSGGLILKSYNATPPSYFGIGPL